METYNEHVKTPEQWKPAGKSSHAVVYHRAQQGQQHGRVLNDDLPNGPRMKPGSLRWNDEGEMDRPSHAPEISKSI